jgi:acylphosphatase
MARRFQVTGYVQNLSDGRVHLEVEGPDDDVEGMLSELKRTMGSLISQVHRTSHPATGQWHDFSIRLAGE